MRALQPCRHHAFGHSFRPSVEPLEGRLCLSVTVSTVSIHGQNVLKIVGDSEANTVAITDQGDGNIEVTDGAGTVLGAGADIDVIKFDGRNGTADVTYTLAAQLTATEAIYLKLGSGGSNTAHLDLTEGAAGAKLKVYVDGGPDADTISAALGALVDSHVKVKIDGDGGDDNISVEGGQTPDGLTIPLQVPGALVNVDADSSLKVEVDGGHGDDTIGAVLSGQVLGHLSVAVDGDKGIDTLLTEISLNADSTGTVRAHSQGGKGVDNVTLNVNDADPSLLAALHAAIVDLSEEDTITSTANVDVILDLPRFPFCGGFGFGGGFNGGFGFGFGRFGFHGGLGVGLGVGLGRR